MKGSEFERSRDEESSFMDQLKTLTGIRLKAPEGFTEAVMNSIYRLKSIEPDTAKVNIYFSRLCKNLGVSLVVASLITVMIFFIPDYHSIIPDIKSGNGIQHTSIIKENLTDMDISIDNMFNSINRSVTRFKEGT